MLTANSDKVKLSVVSSLGFSSYRDRKITFADKDVTQTTFASQLFDESNERPTGVEVFLSGGCQFQRIHELGAGVEAQQQLFV